MSLGIQNNSLRWKEIEKPTALNGCLPYVRDEEDHSLTMGDTPYYNIDICAMRGEFMRVSCTTLVKHTIGVVITVAFEVFHALTLGYCLSEETFLERLKMSGILLLHSLMTPFLLVALQAIAMIGVVVPECARRWYECGESLIYLISADSIECNGYRPLYSFLTLPLHKMELVDRYEKYQTERATNTKEPQRLDIQGLLTKQFFND